MNSDPALGRCDDSVSDFRGFRFLTDESGNLAEFHAASAPGWRSFPMWDLKNGRLARLNVADDEAGSEHAIQFGTMRSHRVFESILDHGRDDGALFFVSNISVQSEGLPGLLKREGKPDRAVALQWLADYLESLRQSGGIENAPAELNFFALSSLKVISFEEKSALQFVGFRANKSETGSQRDALNKLAIRLGISDFSPQGDSLTDYISAIAELRAEEPETGPIFENHPVLSEFHEWLDLHPQRRGVLRENAPAGMGHLIPDAPDIVNQVETIQVFQEQLIPVQALEVDEETVPPPVSWALIKWTGAIFAVLLAGFWLLQANFDAVAGYLFEKTRKNSSTPVAAATALPLQETPPPVENVIQKPTDGKIDDTVEEAKKIDFETIDSLARDGNFREAIAISSEKLHDPGNIAVSSEIRKKVTELTEKWQRSHDPASPLKPVEVDLLEGLFSEIPGAAHLLAADATARLREGQPFVPAPSTQPAAVDWIHESAKLGRTESQRELGKRIFHTSGNSADFLRAVAWFGEAAKAGDPEASFYFGECLVLGKGIGQDRTRGTEFLSRAAEAGDARAMDLLGVCLVRGWGVQVDHKKAVEHFQNAVAYGHLPSCYNLGARFAEGQGVEKNPERAAELFKTGAEGGHPICMLIYGRCFESGFGVKASPKEARNWFLQAARAGNHEAQEWCANAGIEFQVARNSDENNETSQNENP